MCFGYSFWEATVIRVTSESQQRLGWKYSQETNSSQRLSINRNGNLATE